MDTLILLISGIVTLVELIVLVILLRIGKKKEVKVKISNSVEIKLPKPKKEKRFLFFAKRKDKVSIDAGKKIDLKEIKPEKIKKEKLSFKKLFSVKKKEKTPKIKKIKPKKEKFSLKKVKPEQWFIFFIYIIVLGFLAYFAAGSLLPKSIVPIDNNFVISADSLQIFDKLSSFYIDNNAVLGNKETVDNQTVKEITSAQAFNLVLKPKTIIPDGTSATLNIDLVGSGSDVYLNDKPIIPDLTNYDLVADYQNESVYVNKNLNQYYNKSSLIISDNAQDFVYKNFPGASVYSFSDSTNYIPRLDDYRRTLTNVNGIFRGNLELAVYAEESLNIAFTKQDLNMYVGKDEYTVEVKDQDGKSYFKQLYQDDGDTSADNKLGWEQNFNINLNNLPTGIYYITFTIDKYNSAADSTIKNIQVNSNKIDIIGNILPWSKNFNFYTKVVFPKTIGFMYWWKGYDQTISITDTNEYNINLGTDLINKRYDQNLNVGDYNINVPKGYLWIYSDVISPAKQNWFDIPKQNEGNLNKQDIIIINKNKLKISGNNISFSDNVILNKNAANFKLQFINENKLYLKDVQLNIK